MLSGLHLPSPTFSPFLCTQRLTPSFSSLTSGFPLCSANGGTAEGWRMAERSGGFVPSVFPAVQVWQWRWSPLKAWVPWSSLTYSSSLTGLGNHLPSLSGPGANSFPLSIWCLHPLLVLCINAPGMGPH